MFAHRRCALQHERHVGIRFRRCQEPWHRCHGRHLVPDQLREMSAVAHKEVSMKKRAARLVLMAWVLFAAAAVHAATWQVGIKGGVAIQKLAGDDVTSDQVDNRTGFEGGTYAQADFSRSFGMRLEALY